MSSSTWSKTIKFNWIEKMWTQLNSTSFSSADLLCHNFGMPRWRTSDQLLYGGDATMFWTVCLFLGTPKLVLLGQPYRYRQHGLSNWPDVLSVMFFAKFKWRFQLVLSPLDEERIESWKEDLSACFFYLVYRHFVNNCVFESKATSSDWRFLVDKWP